MSSQVLRPSFPHVTVRCHWASPLRHFRRPFTFKATQAQVNGCEQSIHGGRDGKKGLFMTRDHREFWSGLSASKSRPNGWLWTLSRLVHGPAKCLNCYRGNQRLARTVSLADLVKEWSVGALNTELARLSCTYENRTSLLIRFVYRVKRDSELINSDDFLQSFPFLQVYRAEFREKSVDQLQSLVHLIHTAETLKLPSCSTSCSETTSRSLI